MLNSNIHAVCNTCGRTVTLVRCVQHRSTVYTTYLQNLQSRWRHSQVLVLKGFITPYETTLWTLCHLLWWWLLMYIMLDFGVVSVGILLSLICSLWSSAGTCFWFCCHWHAVPCGIDDHFAQTLSCCMCPFGTLAVDAPLAGCKRTVWASLGPTHRYFIDVWQQGQWANAPAGDWSCRLLDEVLLHGVAVG